MSSIILPGSTLGVLGSGQLGRMFAIAAREMGYRIHTYSTEVDSPTGHIADREFTGAYNDLDRIKEFAKTVDVVTFEFENISASAVQAIEQLVPVHPAGSVLHTSQNRIREKTTLQQAGLPVTPFRAINSYGELELAMEELGCCAILKTAQWGYDGKGQRAIDSADQAIFYWDELGNVESIYEKKIDFVAEASVVAARNAQGEIVCCGPIRNEHRNHILDLSVCPDPQMQPLEKQAREITEGVLETLDVVGVMCVELFVTKENELLINEVAPRPHNSGHLTIDASPCSQFEQQVRAICNLPLGDMTPIQPAAMANVMGDLWQNGTPQWEKALKYPGVRLHLYGKQDPRPARKMGHLTATAKTAQQATETVLNARGSLTE